MLYDRLMKKLLVIILFNLLWLNISFAQSIRWKEIPVPQNYVDLGYENEESKKSSGEIFLECTKENKSLFITVDFDNKKIGWSKNTPPSKLEYDIYFISDSFIKGVASINSSKYKIEARQYDDGYVMLTIPTIEVNRLTGHYKINFDYHDLTKKNESADYNYSGLWVVVTPKTTCGVIKKEKKF